MIDPLRRGKQETRFGLARSPTAYQVGEELTTSAYLISSFKTRSSLLPIPSPTSDEPLRILALERDNAQIRRELANLRRELDIVRRSAVDLSPIILYEVQCENYSLFIREELRFVVSLSEDRSLFVGVNEEFTIRLSACSRAELTDKLKQEVLFLWEEYRKAEDNELSPDALRLKFLLLSAIQEQANAEEN